MLLSSLITQVAAEDAATVVARVSVAGLGASPLFCDADTRSAFAGTGDAAVPPFPSWPKAFSPQQLTEPVSARAQVCAPPVAIFGLAAPPLAEAEDPSMSNAVRAVSTASRRRGATAWGAGAM